MADHLQTFLFENTDIRGAIVTLDESFTEMVAQQSYDDARKRLMGQFVAASILLTSNLKFDGMMTLQARAAGAISLVMSECDSDLNYRGIVDGQGDIASDKLAEILRDGTLAITIDPAQGQRYQGIVPLESDTLEGCLQDYFMRSEQLPSWFRFAEINNRVVGVMLQALPAQICKDVDQRQEDWNRITHLASTLTAEEMTTLDNEELLFRLYHEEQVRLFESKPAQFKCNCSRERTERALLSLGAEELKSALEEQGQIETQCHFCNKTFLFNRSEIMHLLQAGDTKNMH